MLILLLIAIIIVAIWYRYKYFVLNHSKALKKIDEINRSYAFTEITNTYMKHSYDNEVSFANVSPKDYLTYQLIYKKKEICRAIELTEENAKKYGPYIEEVNSCALGEYDTDKLPAIAKLLCYMESKLFSSQIKHPVVKYVMTVDLNQTNIRGRYLRGKTSSFEKDHIYEILERMSKRRGDFYLDEEIWQAICRVERGRVSNKMRFAIYERDNYRCRKCGVRSNDLEIDHIFPIAKGGKSNFENLQTLCHRCNSLKSDTVEVGAVNPKAKWQGVNENCPQCGAPLVLKKGRYGDFYGCTNYPKCRFTRKNHES